LHLKYGNVIKTHWFSYLLAVNYSLFLTLLGYGLYIICMVPVLTFWSSPALGQFQFFLFVCQILPKKKKNLLFSSTEQG